MLADPNEEFECRVRYVLHMVPQASRETAIEAVRIADPKLASQCSGLSGPDRIPFGQRTAADAVGAYEAAVVAKIEAGAAPEAWGKIAAAADPHKAHAQVMAETPHLHNGAIARQPRGI
jgi:hypothetical protein